MIGLCLTAMGYPDVEVPDAVDDVDAPQDLKWFGNHPPTELAKLLDRVGHEFVPGLDGTPTIQPLGDGGQPSPPAADVVADLSIPTVDWRGKIVVFTSAPTAAVNTWELYGPDPDVLDFVATGEGVAKTKKSKSGNRRRCRRRRRRRPSTTPRSTTSTRTPRWATGSARRCGGACV